MSGWSGPGCASATADEPGGSNPLFSRAHGASRRARRERRSVRLHHEDAEKLILLYASEIDAGRIRKILTEFCSVLEDEERLKTLDRLLKDDLAAFNKLVRDQNVPAVVLKPVKPE